MSAFRQSFQFYGTPDYIPFNARARLLFHETTLPIGNASHA